MHAKGEQIHIAAWPDLPEMHHLASRHYAFEGRCFVICVGIYMRSSDIPDDFELKSVVDSEGHFGSKDNELFSGGSGIIGPDGQWVVGPVAGGEEIIYADVCLDNLPDETMAFDAAGHYNRPDIFQLTVDERPRDPVNWISEPSESDPSPTSD